MHEIPPNKPKELRLQYDKVSPEYAKMTNVDPAKRFVQYPEALRLMGDLHGKKVLDIGCGNGTFTRMMAYEGAQIVAYDISQEQVKEAERQEREHPLGIKYFVGDRPALRQNEKFDLVSAVMVLTAVEKEQFTEIFKEAGSALEQHGKFVTLTLNPEFKRYGEKVYNRRFHTPKNGHIQIDFFDDTGNVRLSIMDTFFKTEEYEAAAKNAGFAKVAWEKLHVDPAGMASVGEGFWDKFEEDAPYIGFVATKD